jgi:hypothetical protein
VRLYQWQENLQDYRQPCCEGRALLRSKPVGQLLKDRDTHELIGPLRDLSCPHASWLLAVSRRGACNRRV